MFRQALFPEQASTIAVRTDGLFFFLVGVTLFFVCLIAGLILVFMIRYRRRSEHERPPKADIPAALEWIWMVGPFAIAMVIFFWGASIFAALSRAPDDALQVYVVGRQWMWKLQHVEGRREINELHVPIGRPVRLTMTSEDVIHSFFVPAFRVKQDAVPGRYTMAWFEATKPGTYHLFCAEYCGTLHSGMIGRVVAMEPAEFQSWLAGGGTGVPVAAAGEQLFQAQGCTTCHHADASGRGPALVGLFGSTVELVGGGRLVADEAYIRESIVRPQARVVAGYEPIMPTYQGLLDEEALLQLVAYIKSLERPTAAQGQGR